jgi:hypothetical protein
MRGTAAGGWLLFVQYLLSARSRSTFRVTSGHGYGHLTVENIVGMYVRSSLKEATYGRRARRSSYGFDEPLKLETKRHLQSYM